MGFMDELRTHNSLSPNANSNMSAYFGQTGPLNNQELINDRMNMRKEDRFIDTEDWKTRQRFSADQDMVRQNRLQGMMPASGPTGYSQDQGGQGMQAGPMNVVFKDSSTPDKMTPAQMAGLQLDRQRLALETRKADEASQLGQGKLGLAGEAQELNELKNKQIYETKMAESAKKAEDAEARLEIARNRLEADVNNAKAQNDMRQATIDAQKARHELEMTQKDKDRDEMKRVHDAQVAKMNAELENLKNPKVTTTEVNPDGTKKVVTEARGTTNKQTPPTAPAGWNYVRNASNTGWTAVKAGAK